MPLRVREQFKETHVIDLPEYDYTSAGWYFITICAHNRECVFGDVVDGKMILNDYGKIIEEEWLRTSKIRPNVDLDKYIIMPNHIHGIITVVDRRGTLQRAPTTTREQFGKPISNSIPTIIRLFKSTTTKQINEIRQTSGKELWQRNYYEHIIRDERELNKVREYIMYNPLKWEEDKENPKNIQVVG